LRRAAAFLLAAALVSAGAAAGAPSAGWRGVLVVRGGQVLAEENADRFFTPASVNKLYVAAAALELLGPGYRVETEVSALGEIARGELAGDLVLRAAGDPSWNGRFFAGASPLDDLARQVAAAGIRRIKGRVRVDASRFPGRASPATRAIAELPLGYGAPTSGLAVDENTVKVEISPGRQKGDRCGARFVGESYGLELRNEMVTVGRERDTKGTVEIQPVWEERKITLRGEYPLSEPSYQLDLSVPDGDAHAGAAFKAALARAGVIAENRVEVSRQALPPGKRLASVKSAPVAEMLPLLLTESHNWYAEMLLRMIAAQVGEGRSDDGLRLVREMLETQVGVEKGAVFFDDASGLSPFNLTTPRAMALLLEWSLARPWKESFLRALATPGKGTLAAWPALPAGVAAKTGTVQNTLGLAGYLSPRGSSPTIFVVFWNQTPENRGALRRDTAAIVNRYGN
jgi:D-alanyl-D-alanine carboxypeptidase/D-alanyl-D-alanine-endopeptidase (penicillin-binding protein 4)